jgi:predicted thioredoxin/glutaredoxin
MTLSLSCCDKYGIGHSLYQETMMMLPQSLRPLLAATALAAVAIPLSGCTNGNAHR